MKYDDRIKYLIGGYLGIKAMDNYSSRLFVLKDLENYIKDYLKTNRVEGFDYKELAISIEKNTSLKDKLQDSLIVLHEIKGPIELELLIKLKIKEIKYNELK